MEMTRRTKIIATLGPASREPAVVSALVEAGVDVFRMNFSHGTQADHERMFHTVRDCGTDSGRHIAVMQDLQGPKLRTGQMRDDEPVELVSGSKFTLTTRETAGSADCVSTSYQALPQDVKPGMPILLADGAIALEVESVHDEDVLCRVVTGGRLAARQGIHLPETEVSLPTLTEKDRSDLEFGLGLGVDYVALSFVRRAQDIASLRELISKSGSPAATVAKIEKPQALNDITGIIGASDAVMVARGDLGVEMPPEEVPQIQKEIISKCNTAGVPVITATQMLESMVSRPRPTRAEASDVANAIYDGTDAVMLSGETAVGAYPVETVRMMARIAERADTAVAARRRQALRAEASDMSFADAIGQATFTAALNVNAKLILCFTMSGFTARLTSRYRPAAPIVAATQSEEVCRQLALCWGVRSLILPPVSDTDDMVTMVERTLLERGLVQRGDAVLITAGTPLMVAGTTNLIKLHRIGEPTG